jgi:hypothetical protein
MSDDVIKWRLKKDVDSLSKVIFRLQRLAVESKAKGNRHLQNETQGVTNSLREAMYRLKMLI